MRGLLHVRWASAALLATAGACTETTPTQLVVYVDTDMTVPSELDTFRVRVLDEAGALVRDETFPVGHGGEAVELPASFGIVPRGGDAGRHTRVEADGLRGDPATVVVTTAAETGFVEEQSLRLDMFLARRCKDVTCAANEACRPAGCVDVEIDPATLPDDGSDAPGPAGCVPRGLLATRQVYRTVTGLARRGTELLVANIGYGRIDVTDPAVPGDYEFQDFGGNTFEVVTRADWTLVSDVGGLYLGSREGLWLGPDGTFREGLVRAAFLPDGLVVATGVDALVVFDPTLPDEVVGQLEPLLSLWVAVSGSLAFTVWDNSLEVSDITAPEAPVHRGGVSLGASCTNVEAAGAAAFVSCGEAGMRIVDVADPDAPTVVSSPQWRAADIQVRGIYAFVAAREDGLVVLDVSDPAAPALVTTLPVSGSGLASAVLVDGDFAYVGTAEDAPEAPCYVDVFDVACFPAP